MSKKIKLKKIHTVFLIIFLVSAVGLRIWQSFWRDMDLSLKDQKLHVLVAKTPSQSYRGLGGRSDLGEFDGMIFLSPIERKIGIVMRDMQFPIDIVWFLNGEVVDFAPNVPIEHGVAEEDLRVYYPRTEANSVLELSAGWTLNHGLKIGDMLGLVE